MSTTTIRLPDGLKGRLERLATAAGKSTHAYLIDALVETADLRERQEAFEAEVSRRWARYQRSGEYIKLEDLRAYARGLVDGLQPAMPAVRVAKRDAHRRAKKSA